MIDLHIHFLPGVDDGAGSLEESIGMCRTAADAGCLDLVATPHQRREWGDLDPKELRSLLAEVQVAVGSSPRLHLGAEVRAGSGFLEQLELPDRGGLLALADTDSLLVEFSQSATQQEVENIVHEMGLLGFRPIVAHPEFIPVLAQDLGLMRRLIDLGAQMQITAMSVTGDFGRPTQRIVGGIIEAGCAHFVASDAHSLDWRPPGLRAAFDSIERAWGTELAEQLTVSNPRAVLDSRDRGSTQIAP